MTATKSTTVRSLSLPLQAARAGLSGLSRLSPRAGGRAASALFCRVPRHRRPAHEVELLERATPFEVRLGRRALRAWSWGAPDAERLALLVHGWAGRGTQLGSFVDPLVARGFRVVAWDAPGHGASPGRSSSLVEIVDALFAVTRTLRRSPDGLVGHSMGAGAAGVAIAEGLEFGRAAWISPPAGLVHFTRLFTSMIGGHASLHDEVVAAMERRFHVKLDDYEVENVTVPHGERMIVIHDRRDREVGFEHAERVAAALDASDLVATSGLGHRRILKDPDVIDRVTRWLADAR